MRIVISPGQRLPEVSATVSIARSEAVELRDALDRVLTAGGSGWSVSVECAEIEALVSLTLQLDAPRGDVNAG